MKKKWPRQRLGAAVLVALVVALVGFSTYEFYQGNFAVGLAVLPLLVIYYLVFMAGYRHQ